MQTTILNNLGRPHRESLPGDCFISPPRAPSLVSRRPSWSPREFVSEVKDRDTGSEDSQAAGEARIKQDNLEVIRAIVASNMFKDFARAFSDATGLPVSLRPVESFQLPLRNARHEAPFCALMARANRTCGACLKAQAHATELPSEDAQTTVCYAGLCETAVPVRLGHRLIGFLWTGQVFQRKPTQRQFDRTLKLLTSWGVEVDPKVLQEAYFGTRVVPSQSHAAAVRLLRIFAEHLAMVSNQLLIQSNNAEPAMITKAKDFIREHHAEDLTLPGIAKFSNTSHYYFCKVFKQVTRLTFTQFLSRTRIESSTKLLTNPQLRVSEVAYAAGFQSLTHFNRVFQKILGQSPTEYRLAVQNRRKPG